MQTLAFSMNRGGARLRRALIFRPLEIRARRSLAPPFKVSIHVRILEVFATHEPGRLRVGDPRCGPRLCEAQRFMVPMHSGHLRLPLIDQSRAIGFLSARFFGNERRLMTKARTLLILLAAGMVQMQQPVQSAGSPSNTAERDFKNLSDELIAGYLAWRPQTGTALGLHEYDGRLTDYSRASFEAELARLKRLDQRLAALDARSLSPRAHYDFRILQASIKNEIFQFEDVEGY